MIRVPVRDDKPVDAPVVRVAGGCDEYRQIVRRRSRTYNAGASIQILCESPGAASLALREPVVSPTGLW